MASRHMAYEEGQGIGPELAAIFVHAGAGFHSIANEGFHLDVCADAASAAMKVLKTGASAVDAVELAIRVLEDNEITNAGFGSNLTINGVVECDATIVDFLGRSGAVGAISQVRNPISVARLVYEATTRPLSLRRVAPNLLTGQGATEFARECGIRILPHDFMVSELSWERYQRWQKDLENAAMQSAMKSTPSPRPQQTPRLNTPPSIISGAEVSASAVALVDPNTAPLINEAQPATPQPAEKSRSRLHQLFSPNPKRLNTNPSPEKSTSPRSPRQADGSSYFDRDLPAKDLPESMSVPRPISTDFRVLPPLAPDQDPTTQGLEDDCITDTVGAIAIDTWGRIACAASSGGIGMKHKGRTGPAALVGVGSAVIPTRWNDSSNTSVGVVTSGTGEHMATTMAAQTCALRLNPPGHLVPSGRKRYVDEDEALRAFIQEDFLHHPSVRHSQSKGAIGVLALKRTITGIRMFWAHNTQSFAIASMSSDDALPHTVMSREGVRDPLTIGSRSIKPKRDLGRRQREHNDGGWETDHSSGADAEEDDGYWNSEVDTPSGSSSADEKTGVSISNRNPYVSAAPSPEPLQYPREVDMMHDEPRPI